MTPPTRTLSSTRTSRTPAQGTAAGDDIPDEGDTKLFKQFMDNEGFKRWMTDTVFGLTYGGEAGA